VIAIIQWFGNKQKLPKDESKEMGLKARRHSHNGIWEQICQCHRSNSALLLLPLQLQSVFSGQLNNQILNGGHPMPGIPAQIWKGSTFSIERNVGNAPGVAIFRFSGPFTARDMFGTLTPETLRNLFESQSDDAQSVQIFDLTDVPYMDSAGLGMIVSQYVRCQGKGLRMVTVGASPRVQQLFSITKVDRFIPMASSVEEAETH
jgi:anti-anti-sigma factor